MNDKLIARANPNLAAGKRILEEVCYKPNRNSKGLPFMACSECPERGKCCKVHNPDGMGHFTLTDGNVRDYNEYVGYVSVLAPGTITLDLEQIQSVQTLQFLLWDNCGGDKSENCNRKYQYRILVSEDGERWRVLFDTFREGYCGWQRLDLSSPIPMRYIRFHALTINDKTPPPFMLVELEAYAHELECYSYRFSPTLHTDINVDYAITKRLDTLDQLTPHKLSRFFSAMITNLVDDVHECESKGRSELKLQLDHLIQAMRSIKHDVVAYEEDVDDIKGKILYKTDDEIRKNKILENIGIVSFFLGLIATVVSALDFLGLM